MTGDLATHRTVECLNARSQAGSWLIGWTYRLSGGLRWTHAIALGSSFQRAVQTRPRYLGRPHNTRLKLTEIPAVNLHLRCLDVRRTFIINAARLAVVNFRICLPPQLNRGRYVGGSNPLDGMTDRECIIGTESAHPQSQDVCGGNPNRALRFHLNPMAMGIS